MPKNKEDAAPAVKKPVDQEAKKAAALRVLYDELELLKAEGNKNPNRLAELKQLIAEG